jgi:cell shape-determining protein MreD
MSAVFAIGDLAVGQPVGVQLIAFGSALFIAPIVALGLHRRRRWALLVAALGLGAVCVISLVAMVWLVVDPPASGSTVEDMTPILVMGAAMWAGMSALPLTILLHPSTRRGFRASPPGWYGDPSARCWRWWDGHGWTDHVA